MNYFLINKKQYIVGFVFRRISIVRVYKLAILVFIVMIWSGSKDSEFYLNIEE